MESSHRQPFDAPLRCFLGSPLLHVGLIALVALIAYANSFGVPFLFDDESSIVYNDEIRTISNFLGSRIGYDSMPNRYVGYLTFALNHHFGGLNPFGYHLVNLLVHLGNGLLVYVLVLLIMRTPFFTSRLHGNVDPIADSDSPAGTNRFLALFTALLFTSHPIQTQAVTYIVQRLSSLATLFYLASLVCHLRWRLSRQKNVPFLSRQVLPYWLLSLVCAVLAMKTKEIAFTLPLAALLCEFCFFGRPVVKRLAEWVPLLLTALVIPVTMLSIPRGLGQVLSHVGKATMESDLHTRWEYLFTQFSVIITYLRLLLLPVNQKLDYDYPVNHSLMEPRALLAFLVLLALLGLAIWLFKVSSRSTAASMPAAYLRLAAFGIIWFFLTLAVESSIIPINDLIFEHRLYLPSVGFFLALSGLVPVVCSTWSPEKRYLLLGGVTLLLTVATLVRNGVWASEIGLWRDTVAKSPGKSRAHANLAVAYAKQERVEEALREFETAMQLAPDQRNPYEFINPGPLSNLVILYVSIGRQRDAAAACSAILKRDPDMELPINLYKILRMPRTSEPPLSLVQDVCGIPR